jgi:hypothetical protein
MTSRNQKGSKKTARFSDILVPKITVLRDMGSNSHLMQKY